MAAWAERSEVQERYEAAWLEERTMDIRAFIGRARDAQDLHGRVYGGQLAIPSGESLGAEPAVNDPRPPAHSTDAPLHRPADHTTHGASRLADGKQPSPSPIDGPGLPSAGRVCGRRTHFYGGSCSREWGHKGCCRA